MYPLNGTYEKVTLRDFTFLATFRAVFEEHRERNGSTFIVLEHLPWNAPNVNLDPESLGMFRIRFVDDGKEITAHPEEVVKTVCNLPYRVFVSGKWLSE